MKYLHFFDEFGTHFVKKAHLGAMYGEQSEISAKSWNKMVDTGIDIKASASYSGAFNNDLFAQYTNKTVLKIGGLILNSIKFFPLFESADVLALPNSSY